MFCEHAKNVELAADVSKLEKVFDSAKSENLSEAQELEALVASTTDDEAAKGGEQSTADEQTTADEQESEVQTAREPPEEEVIRCVCNILREYGEMWQCEKCKVRPSLHLLRNFPDNIIVLSCFCSVSDLAAHHLHWKHQPPKLPV